MKILIDTHILIWFLEDNPRLLPKHKSYIEDAENQIYVSKFSFVEIAIKL